MSVLKRVRTLVRYATILRGPADLFRYAWLRWRSFRGVTAGQPRPLRLRVLGGSVVWCRPSRDVWTLKHTFIERFHLPPVDLPNAAIIVDLGSNVGYTVAHLAWLYPQARVLGVEMDAGNLELARRNTANFGPRVQLVHAAVWNYDGVVRYSGKHDDAFRVNEHADGGVNEISTAPARRLSTLLDEWGADRVDYVKMDIEGAEAVVLAGALDWAERVRSLKIELHPPADHEGVRAVLERNGYRTWSDPRHPACICAVQEGTGREPAGEPPHSYASER
jgi:FkbM family methyltransferase